MEQIYPVLRILVGKLILTLLFKMNVSLYNIYLQFFIRVYIFRIIFS